MDAMRLTSVLLLVAASLVVQVRVAADDSAQRNSAPVPVALFQCSRSDLTSLQAWDIDAVNNSIRLRSSSNPPLCLDLASPWQKHTPVQAAACDDRSQTQRFVLDTKSNTIVHTPSGLCVSSQSDSFEPGTLLDVWACESTAENERWFYSPGNGSIADDRGMCATSGGSVQLSFVADAKTAAHTFDGIGGLSAGASSRQLFDYPRQQREAILDALFDKQTGVWQVFKNEIGGDVQSSYGSESSYQHTRGHKEMTHGYELWLLQQAKQRNPDMPTYCLSWGVPAWVGNGSYLSQEGVQYHVDYVDAVREQFNITYDYVGIWNEDSWTADYIEQLRAALDSRGFKQTKIVAADGRDDIISGMLKDAKLRAVVDVIGLHSAPTSVDGANAAAMGKPFWQSENNIIDDPMWPTGKWEAGIRWVAMLINNYIVANATSTIECPLFHGWSQNYGRNNHGSSYFNDPWSGHFQIGAPFAVQQHITKTTRVGWRFLRSNATFSSCGSKATSGDQTCDLVSAALVSSDLQDMSWTLVNQGIFSARACISLQNLHGSTQSLSHFRSTPTAWFERQPNVAGDPSTPVPYCITVQPNEIHTLTTLSNVQPFQLSSPPRTAPKLPLSIDFQTQEPGQPGYLLSDNFGAFDVVADSSSHGNLVLQQSVPENPGPNSWHGSNVHPATTLPSGTNWMNYRVQVKARFGQPPMSSETDALRLCGRVGMFSRQTLGVNGLSPTTGVCLTLFINGTWILHENGGTRCKDMFVLATGTTSPVRQPSLWTSFDLSFSEFTVDARLDGKMIAVSAPITVTNGVVLLGTDWNTGQFDNLVVNATAPQTSDAFVIDAIVGQKLADPSVVAGWAGTVLNTTAVTYPTFYHSDHDVGGAALDGRTAGTVTHLGRFKAPNNTLVHSIRIFNVSGNGFIPGAETTVNMASCQADVTGFCYGALSSPVALATNHLYYIVSNETASSVEKGSGQPADAFYEMTEPATATSMSRRDGLTYLSYRLPGFGHITGRVWGNPSKWNVTADIDTMFGPVSWRLAASQTHAAG